jgi:hypothetical protein
MAIQSYPAQLPRTAVSASRSEAVARRRVLPWIVLSCSAGVAVDSIANAIGRTGRSGGEAVFWLAVVLVIFPAALRLTSRTASSAERLATVVVVGLALYAFKILQNPFAFTYADEWVHLYTLQSIVHSGLLFVGNPLLPVTTRYPGLEAFTAAIVKAGGLHDFAAGLVAIAASRIMMMAGLYVLYERLSGSARAAGLAALLYAATPEFLYFSSEFSYESLAIPLATVALIALVRHLHAPDRATRLRWGAALLVIDAAVVITHHITSYALFGLLVAVCLLQSVLRGHRRAPWVITGLVGAMTLAWLSLVAGGTLDYLGRPVAGAFNRVIATISQEAPPRTLFVNPGAVEQTPSLDRYVAIAGLLMLIGLILVGVRVLWRDRQLHQPVIVLFGLAALAYIGTLPLRLVTAAWETADRLGQFLFLGVALIAVLGMLRLLSRRRPERRMDRWATAGLVTLVFASGAIAGWPVSLFLSRPFVSVASSGRILEPPVATAARWSRRVLGPNQRIAAPSTDARLFLIDGRQYAIEGLNTNISDMLATRKLAPWEIKLMRYQRIDFVAADRRTISTDITAGYFFDVDTLFLSSATQTKFQVAGRTDRLYDGGSLVIYDVRRLW